MPRPNWDMVRLQRNHSSCRMKGSRAHSQGMRVQAVRVTEVGLLREAWHFLTKLEMLAFRLPVQKKIIRVRVGPCGRRDRSPAARQCAPVRSASETSAGGGSCSHWEFQCSTVLGRRVNPKSSITSTWVSRDAPLCLITLTIHQDIFIFF